MFKNKVMLITYPDSLGGDLNALQRVLKVQFDKVFAGGVHILPLFPSSGDRGFSPLTYFEVAPEFGDWDSVKAIGADNDVMVDLMVNHISRHSVYFKDFQKHGRASEWADLFITLDKVWPDGIAPAEDVNKIFLRKPDHPFSDIEIEATGEVERIWTSFGVKDWAEQIDLDVYSPLTQQLLKDFFKHLAENGVSIIRLDAVGYVTKKPGTSCFWVEPEIYDFVAWVTKVANDLGLQLLPEVHAHYETQFALADHGSRVYDFVLPAMVLHTLYTGNSEKLKDYLKVCPRNQYTTLDTHDGIPIQPDMDDLLTIAEAQNVVDVCLDRGANLNRILGKHKAHPDFDAHQINITYYDAVGRDDDQYIISRALQFFAPGAPQVYYVGALAGENDPQAQAEQGEGRAINRHNYTVAEIDAAMQRPVVQRLWRMMHFRNRHPAFDGELLVLDCEINQISLRWTKGDDYCQLDVDLSKMQCGIIYTDEQGELAVYHP